MCVCVVLVIQHIFPRCLKRHDLRKKVIEHKMGFYFLCNSLYQIFLIFRRITRDFVINVKASSCTVPVILVRFQSKPVLWEPSSMRTEKAGLEVTTERDLLLLLGVICDVAIETMTQ